MVLRSFYYLRHGRTQANLDGLMCGGLWDVPLAEEGIVQANGVSAFLPSLEKPPTAVFVSPLERARQTAEIVVAKLALPVEVIADLREWELGEWDRIPVKEVREKFLGTGEPPGGETREAFRARAMLALSQCAVHGEPPLIVGHGGFGVILQEALGIPRARMENCALYLFSRESGEWKLTGLHGCV